jgi:cytochrome P450
MDQQPLTSQSAHGQRNLQPLPRGGVPRNLDPETGRLALWALIRERSLLGPLKVLFSRVGHVFRIPLPAFHPFVVAGPDANRRVLVTERAKVRWRNPDPVTEVLHRGVLVMDGEEHDLYRGLMDPLLKPGALPAYAPSMVQHTDRVRQTWQDGQIVDMLVEGRKIALLIVMDTLFGVQAWDDLPRIWQPILKTIQYISPGAWILWRSIPRPGFRGPMRRLDEYLFRIIRDRRAGPAKRDLLQHLIDAGLDDGRIRDQMLTMLIAGHDTSTALLAWAFYLLGSNPDVMCRLTLEIREALGDQPPPSTGGWQPPLLDHVIKEALRLYPPIHLGNRMVEEDMDFDGQRVASGERMFYSIYLTHRDPKYWIDGEDFCPERFAGGRRTPPFAYVPFGGGPRACIGAAFGQAEARLVLGRLLQCHDFELTNPRVRAHMGATLEPRPGVSMRLRRPRTGPL